MTTNVITPTKETRVFIAYCDHFGYINTEYYKDWEIRNGEGIICTGGTFAISFANAVERLHEWICENNWAVQEYPKAVFGIEVIDGTLDRRGEIRRVEVYRISAGKAKKYL